MQSDHNRPKIASSSRKLPEAFISSSRTIGMMPGKKHKNSNNNDNGESKEVPNFKKPTNPQKRKNKNPLQPVRDCIRMMKQFQNGLNSLQQKQSILSDKYSKLNFENRQLKANKQEEGQNLKIGVYQKSYSQPVKQKKKYNQIKIKYENCITITVLKKFQNGCLKKILYVPRLTVHFLRQITISNQMDKNQLHQWIQQMNMSSSKYGIKILELFWNTPQGYYSVMYDYYQGQSLHNLMEQMYSIPFPIIKSIIVCHLNSPPPVYNSQIFIGNGNQNPSKVLIKYLPLSEQQQNPGASIKRITEYYEQKQQEYSEIVNAPQVLIGRLGILILFCYFGEVIIQEDFNQLMIKQRQANKKPCCLLHDLLSVDKSLSKQFLNSNSHDKTVSKYLELVCSILKYKTSQQIKMQKIMESSFMKEIDQNEQFPCFNEIKQALQFNPEADGLSKTINIANNKQLNNILDAIQLILQNVKHYEVNVELVESSFRIKRLARELGLDLYIIELVEQLKDVYKGWV